MKNLRRTSTGESNGNMSDAAENTKARGMKGGVPLSSVFTSVTDAV